jgi:hypothetical protein
MFGKTKTNKNSWVWKQTTEHSGVNIFSGKYTFPNGDLIEASFYFGSNVPFDRSLVTIQVTKNGVKRKSSPSIFNCDCTLVEKEAMQEYRNM